MDFIFVYQEVEYLIKMGATEDYEYAAQLIGDFYCNLLFIQSDIIHFLF